MRKHLPHVHITHVDSRGRGRGTAEAGDGSIRPVLTTDAYPGDTVDVRVRRRKAGSYLGEVERIHARGVERTPPFCIHFADCGGCTIQDIAYDAQLSYKHAMVRAAFRERGFVFADDPSDFESVEPDGARLPPLPRLPAVRAAPRDRRYRNKLEFTFGAQRWLTEGEIDRDREITDRRGLGFHVAGRFDRVLDLSECHLQPEPSEAIREFVRAFTIEEGLTFYDARRHTGLLRLLIVRTSLRGETMVIVMFGEDDEPGRTLVMEAIHARFPAIESLLYVVNESKNDSLYPHEVHTWAGRAYINEQCGPNTLRVRAKAFYQTNPEQALRLYELALDMADLRGTELVFDLYCGIGSIALLAAGRAGRVIGVESVTDAVAAARENARINTIVNTGFATGEVESVLPELIAGHGVPDLVICDPPRVGLHPGARRAVLEAAPARIVYISCNPRTQADDLRELAARYRVSAIQPVDMFPQTRHVENVLLLERSV